MSKKKWVLFGVGAFLAIFFFFNDHFQNTRHRQKAIKKANVELESLSKDIEQIKNRVARLENDPAAMEQMVRRQLGYLRPGEKEVRFVKKQN